MLRDIPGQVRQYWQESIWARDSLSGPRGRRIRILASRAVYIVATRFVRDRMNLRAGALTYVTLLSLVPALAAAFALFVAFGGLEASYAKLRDLLLDALVIVDRETVVYYLDQFISNIRTGALGGVSVLILFVSVVSLLATVEQTFNDIWGVVRGRRWMERFQTYWPIITLGPVCLGLALSISAAATHAPWFESIRAGPILGIIDRLLTLCVIWFLFSFLYALMPNTKVPIRCAAIGGIVAGTLWIIAKEIFTTWATSAVTYSTIYGSLATIPLFILWLYASWIITLVGGSLSFAVRAAVTYQPEPENPWEVSERDREYIATLMVARICEAYERGDGAVATEQLVDRIEAPAALSRRILGELVSASVLLEIAVPNSLDPAYAPSRPLRSLELLDVVRVIRAGSDRAVSLAFNSTDVLARRVGDALIKAENALEASLEGTSLDRLLAES